MLLSEVNRDKHPRATDSQRADVIRLWPTHTMAELQSVTGLTHGAVRNIVRQNCPRKTKEQRGLARTRAVERRKRNDAEERERQPPELGPFRECAKPIAVTWYQCRSNL